MKTIRLSNEKYTIDLSQITFGGAVAWHYEDKEKVTSLLNAYIANGGTTIDTARVYGDSEQVIGEWLATQDREKLILSTKGAHPPFGNMRQSRLDRENIMSDFQQSMELLKTDYVDLYFLHRDDENIPVSEIMPTLHELVASGKVHFLGASNWTTARIEEANRYAKENGLTPFSISQIDYSLAKGTDTMGKDPTIVYMTDEEFAWYEKNQFPVMAFSSQAGGLFTKYLSDPNHPKINRAMLTEENIRRAQVVKEISERTNQSPTAVALSYVMETPFPVVALIGSRSMEQLEDSLSALNYTVTEAEWNELNGK